MSGSSSYKITHRNYKSKNLGANSGALDSKNIAHTIIGFEAGLCTRQSAHRCMKSFQGRQLQYHHFKTNEEVADDFSCIAACSFAQDYKHDHKYEHEARQQQESTDTCFLDELPIRDVPVRMLACGSSAKTGRSLVLGQVSISSKCSTVRKVSQSSSKLKGSNPVAFTSTKRVPHVNIKPVAVTNCDSIVSSAEFVNLGSDCSNSNRDINLLYSTFGSAHAAKVELLRYTRSIATDHNETRSDYISEVKTRFHFDSSIWQARYSSTNQSNIKYLCNGN